ncbi:MAG: carbohydrate-binding family 9-like protein, partial [Calditrichota bacterium]
MTANYERANVKYQVKEVDHTFPLILAWHTKEWRSIPQLQLTHHMGKLPSHFPLVEVKLAYNSRALFAVFRVQDQFVRAGTKSHQGPVYQDSCVEFFFTPESIKQQRYYNLEVNCSGKMLFHYQSKPRKSNSVSESSLNKIEIASTLPAVMEPEYTA